jgi:hypothetical protein
MKKIYSVSVVCADCGNKVYDDYTMESVEVGASAPICDHCEHAEAYVTHYDYADLWEGEEVIKEYVGGNSNYEGYDVVESGQIWISTNKPPALDWFTPKYISEKFDINPSTIKNDLYRNGGKLIPEILKGYIRYSGNTLLIHRDAIRRVYEVEI